MGRCQQDIDIPTWKCEDVNMDFVVGFPRTRRQHESIWVIVDRSTKSTHFLLVKNSYSAEEYPKLYVKETVKLHGVPLFIISDRGVQLTLIFRDVLTVGLVLKLSLVLLRPSKGWTSGDHYQNSLTHVEGLCDLFQKELGGSPSF